MDDGVHSARRLIPAPIREVFALVEDPHAHLARLPESDMVGYECHYEAGPPRGVGAVYRLVTIRADRRKPHRTTVTITAHDPPRRVEFTGEAGMATVFELEPAPGDSGTLVTCSRVYRGVRSSRALNRVVRPETVVESLERDLERLEQALRSDA